MVGWPINTKVRVKDLPAIREAIPEFVGRVTKVLTDPIPHPQWLGRQVQVVDLEDPTDPEMMMCFAPDEIEPIDDEPNKAVEFDESLFMPNIVEHV